MKRLERGIEVPQRSGSRAQAGQRPRNLREMIHVVLRERLYVRARVLHNIGPLRVIQRLLLFISENENDRAKEVWPRTQAVNISGGKHICASAGDSWRDHFSAKQMMWG